MVVVSPFRPETPTAGAITYGCLARSAGHPHDSRQRSDRGPSPSSGNHIPKQTANKIAELNATQDFLASWRETNEREKTVGKTMIATAAPSNGGSTTRFARLETRSDPMLEIAHAKNGSGKKSIHLQPVHCLRTIIARTRATLTGTKYGMKARIVISRSSGSTMTSQQLPEDQRNSSVRAVSSLRFRTRESRPR
jgi:hypothetical protein